MLDNKINPDAPTKMEDATEYHWGELNRTGTTVFNSDEETRVIDMDLITLDCLNDFMLIGLHKATQEGLPFIDALRGKIRTKKHELMEEALEDFYK